MTDTDIDAVARSAYANGVSPIDWAVTVTKTQIECRDMIRDARRHTPSAFPIFVGSLDDDAVARRIVGRLLDAGWIPPGGMSDLVPQ